MALGLIIGLLNTGTVSAADKEQSTPAGNQHKPIGFDISIGSELMSGDTTYSIGGPVTYADGFSEEGYFPWSELEWPLDVWLARLDADLTIGSSWRISGAVKTNISDPGDNMIDKDWTTSSNPGQLDIYSESNISDFSALIWDIDIEWAFLQRQSWNLYAGLGYQYQKFEYDSQLIHQYSPSGLPGWEFYGDGSVTITYEITYKMPYLLVGTDFQISPDFSISGSFAYSPLVDAQDEDHHLSRGRVAKGDMDGEAYMIDVSGKYKFFSSWFLEAGLYFTKIDVDGDLSISSNGVHILKEYEESESTQTSGYLNIGYRF